MTKDAPGKIKVTQLVDELLLYSGQYAIFYILMNFSQSGMKFFSYPAHMTVLAALVLQSYFLAKYGNKLMPRILGSLISPVIYTLIEWQEFQSFMLNTGHAFFWGFSILSGLINALSLKYKSTLKIILECSVVFLNVIMFLAVYFYADLMHGLASKSVGGNFSIEYVQQLSILNFSNNLEHFFADDTHIYLTLGGILLGIGLALGHYKIHMLKNTLNQLFGVYVDHQIRDKIIANKGILEERKKITILFSDIRDFTSLSEQNDPSKIIQMLNQYFGQWEVISSKNSGLINKFIGDAVMILFGLSDVKKENPDLTSESDAVSCAINFLNQMSLLNHQLKENGLPSIENIGIGIHTGEAIIGNLGSDIRKEFTVIGDVVNTASRLETLTKTEGHSLIISTEVFEALTNDLKVHFEFGGTQTLKGKSEPFAVYYYHPSN